MPRPRGGLGFLGPLLCAPSLRSGGRVGADRHPGAAVGKKKKEPEKTPAPRCACVGTPQRVTWKKKSNQRAQPGQWKVKMLLGLRRCLPACGVVWQAAFVSGKSHCNQLFVSTTSPGVAMPR